jgi:hypothetical protein
MWCGFRPGEELERRYAQHPMTHIAVRESLNGKNVDGVEKVSDAQYQR